METTLLTLGRIAGLAGAAVFALAIAARLFGVFWLGGFQVGSILLVAIGAMVFGCFTLLLALARHFGEAKPKNGAS